MSSNPNTVIGIDVGLTGAICINKSTSFTIHKMPLSDKTEPSYNRWYDINTILEIFRENRDAKVFLEHQRPMSKQGVVSVFRLGRGFGLIEGLAKATFSDITMIDPKTWQNYLHKKYITKEEETAFKDNPLNLLDKIESPYKELYEKKANTKSFKTSKLNTFYCLYKSGYIKDFDLKVLKDHDKIDSFMISLYGTLICCA